MPQEDKLGLGVPVADVGTIDSEVPINDEGKMEISRFTLSAKDTNVLSVARESMKRFNLMERLDLDPDSLDTDYTLLFLTQRLLREEQAQIQQLINRPDVMAMARLPIVGKLFNTAKGEAERLKVVQEGLGRFVKESIADDPGEADRASLIERAVNALTAECFESTRSGRRTNSKPSVNFSPSEDMLSTWQERWKPQFSESPGQPEVPVSGQTQ